MRLIKKGYIHHKNKQSKVFLINDLHFKKGTDQKPNLPDSTNGGRRYYYASPNNLRDFVKIANTEKPDLILLLGDVCDHPSDFALFKEIWKDIDPSISKFVTLGNHDFDELNYDDLVNILDMKNEPVVAGSKFNRTFEIENNLYIVIDTTFNTEGNHGSHYIDVCMLPETIDWLRDTISKSENKNIFICTHVGIQLKNIQYFEKQQSEAIQQMIEDNKKDYQIVTWLYGHHHVLEREKQTNSGSENIGYILPANILWEQGRFTEVVVKQNNFNLNTRILDY